MRKEEAKKTKLGLGLNNDIETLDKKVDLGLEKFLKFNSCPSVEEFEKATHCKLLLLLDRNQDLGPEDILSFKTR